jgi:hypothetical protein
MIRFNCHRCGMLIQAADTGVGRDAKCPGCGLMLVIPTPAEAIPAPPPPPAPAEVRHAAPPDAPAALPVPPGPTPVPPVVVPVPAFAPIPTSVSSVPPASPPAPPGFASVSSTTITIPLGGLSISQSALPVPPGGMPVPPPGSPLVISNGAPTSPDAALFDGLMSDAPLNALANGAADYFDDDGAIPNLALRNLGLAAIAFGVAGFGLSWIPFAGLGLALVGLAASGVATVVGSSRRGAPMGLAVAGAMAGIVGVAFGSYWTYSSFNKSAESELARADHGIPGAKLSSSVSGSTPGDGAASKPLTPAAAAGTFGEGAFLGVVGGDARDDRDPVKFASGAFRNVQSGLAKEIAAAGRQSHSTAGRPRLVFGGNDNGNGLVVSAAKPEGADEESTGNKQSGGAAADAPIQWAAAEKGEPQGSGPLQVTVAKVVVGKVVSYPIGDLQTLINVTSEPYMIVWLKVKNTDASGSAEFAGWMSPQAEDQKIESKLIDDHGREHKPIRPFNKDEAIQKTTPPGKIFAGQTATDAIVFRVLTDDVDSMDLTLSGKAIGRDEDLHFRVPSSMIARDNSNPLLGGAGN